MAQYALLELTYAELGGTEGLSWAEFKINGFLTRFNYADVPQLNDLEFNDFDSLVAAVEYAVGGAYTVTNTSNTFKIVAKNYGDNYNFGVLNQSNLALSVIQQLDNISPLDVSQTHENENVGNDGSIDVTVSGGIAPYTYQWSDGPTTQDRAGLVSGIYHLTVTDDEGTEEELWVAIQNIGILIEVDATDALCNGSSTGTATVTVTGGTAPYEYEWSDGPTTKDRNDLPAGTFQLTVTDANDYIRMVEVVIGEPPAIIIQSTIDGQDITLNVSGGAAPYTYQWDDGPTTKDRMDVEPGEYEVLVTDANGCSNSATILVEAFKFYFTKNPVELTVIVADPQTKPNLTVVCEVHIEDDYLSGTFAKALESEQPVDEEGRTVFDVQEIIDAYISGSPPDLNQSAIALSDTFRRFYLRYYEKHGNPPAPDDSIQANTYYAQIGGLNEWEFAKRAFFNSHLPTNKPFFSWEPQVKAMYSGQRDTLYYMVNSFDMAEIKVMIEVTYNDQSTETFQRYATSHELNRYEVYCFPVDIDRLNLILAKTPVSYKVWVSDQDDIQQSEIREYILDEARVYFRQFIYRNSLGGFNTLVCNKPATASARVKAEVISRILAPGYLPSDASFQVLNKTFGTQMRIGQYVNNSEGAHLIDFAISKEVYEIRSGYLIPVQIECDPDYLDQIENYNEFEFKVIQEDITHYTPDL